MSTPSADSAALRRLPQLKYNVQSYKNFILRYEAYFSRGDDLYDVLEGSFWKNRGYPDVKSVAPPQQARTTPQMDIKTPKKDSGDSGDIGE